MLPIAAWMSMALVVPSVEAQYETHDSAGVRIAVSLGPAWTVATRWSVPAQAIFDVGSLGGEIEFGSVADVRGLADGGVVVADRMSHKIHVFSIEGRLQASFGREGEGPGEFKRIASLQVLTGDTIAVFDQALARFSKFTADGTLLGEISVRPEGVPGIESVVQIPEGLVLTGYVLAGPGRPGFSDTTYPLILFDPRTATHQAILNPMGSQLYRSAEGYIQRAPILRSKSTAVGDRIYVGNGEHWRIDVYGFDATHEASWRRSDVDFDLSEAAFRDLTGALVADLPDENARRLWRRVYAEQPTPSSVPAYDKLIAATDHLWVRIYQLPPVETERWAVFDGAGRFDGELGLPAGFELLDVGDSLLLGIQRDEYDAESVRGYLLNHGSSG